MWPFLEASADLSIFSFDYAQDWLRRAAQNLHLVNKSRESPQSPSPSLRINSATKQSQSKRDFASRSLSRDIEGLTMTFSAFAHALFFPE
jgi:hypothetical protein